MSIERMKRVWLLVEARELRKLLQLLSQHEIMHIADLAKSAEGSEIVGTVTTDTTKLDNRIAGAQHTLDIFNTFAPVKRTFGDNFLPMPLEVTRQEYHQAREEMDADELAEKVGKIAETHAAHERRLEEVELERHRLRPFREAEAEAPPEFKRCVGRLGIMVLKGYQQLTEDEEGKKLLAGFSLAAKDGGGMGLVQVVSLREEEQAVTDLLRKHDFEALALRGGRPIREIVKGLEEEASKIRGELERLAREIRGLAQAHRRCLTIRLAQMETGRRTLTTFEKAVSGERVAVVSGYVRVREIGKLEKVLAEELPSTGMEVHEPKPEETVPVSLRANAVFAPGEFLVDMFGVPNYWGFDPSPFITFTFLLFFGFCFGDAIYGLGLMILGGLLAYRYRAYRTRKLFFILMVYGGFASLLVGMLTGSWAADLWDAKYLGENNVLMRIAQFFQVADMLKQPMPALIVALAIGALNQFYGIFMKMYSDFRKGDVAGALFDGGLWFVYLPGLMMIGLAGAGVVKETWMMPTGIVLTLGGAAGLVLTQGRNEKTFFAKALVGFVSLYGIMGSYGTTSFVGDTLSYCRLLALGLTTTVVGLSLNLIGSLLLGIPLVGLGVFIVFLVLVHGFNFLVSTLGAFVHSARLIFVEFFGRFYDPSGQRFEPLGRSERVRVTDNPE